MKEKVSIRNLVKDIEFRAMIYQYVLQRVRNGESNINTAIVEYFRDHYECRVKDGVKYFPEIMRAKQKPFRKIYRKSMHKIRCMSVVLTEDKEFIMKRSIRILNKKRKRIVNA